MTAPRPTATGTLGQTPLLHVLVSLLELRATGTLVLETTDRKRSALLLERGAPVKARLATSDCRLGEVLVKAGWLDQPVADQTFHEAATQRRLHGEWLAERNVLPKDIVDRALRSQLLQKLVLMATLPGDTFYGFYDKTDFLANQPGSPTPVAPLVALWQLAKSCATPTITDPVILRLKQTVLRLHPQAQPHQFGLDSSEQALVEVLRARPQVLASLEQLGLLSTDALHRLTYTLIITRHLQFGESGTPLGLALSNSSEQELLVPHLASPGARPLVLAARGPLPCARQPVAPSTTPQVSPAASPVQRKRAPLTSEVSAIDQHGSPLPDPDETVTGGSTTLLTANAASSRRRDLEQLAAKLSGLDHYEVLGVARDAPAAAIQAAYFQLAKLYHPDRLSGELADMRGTATTVFARMTESYQVLTDPTRRTEYDTSTGQDNRTEEEEAIHRVLRAAAAFQKAEVLVKKRMWPAAELEVNRAIEDDPTQADYLALAAWIMASKPDSDARLAEVLRMLDDAIERNPRSDKNRFYRVQVLRRLGRIDEAVADCRIIVENNPYHVDAQREIRLYDMRRAAAPAQSVHRPAAPPGARKGPGESPSRHTQQTSAEHPTPAGLFGRLFKR